RVAGRRVQDRAAVQAAGELPEHEQDGREGGLGPYGRRARAADRRPLCGGVADVDDRGGAERAQARGDPEAVDVRAEGALGGHQEGVPADQADGGERRRSGGAGDRDLDDAGGSAGGDPRGDREGGGGGAGGGGAGAGAQGLAGAGAREAWGGVA